MLVTTLSLFEGCTRVVLLPVVLLLVLLVLPAMKSSPSAVVAAAVATWPRARLELRAIGCRRPSAKEG